MVKKSLQFLVNIKTFIPALKILTGLFDLPSFCSNCHGKYHVTEQNIKESFQFSQITKQFTPKLTNTICKIKKFSDDENYKALNSTCIAVTDVIIHVVFKTNNCNSPF